eukprot:2757130-Amphidinium_carterae.1
MAFADLKYPEGLRPGTAVAGHEGEYFRYSQVLVKPPDDEDRRAALRMAEDVRCAVCDVILGSLVAKSESMSEDHLMDQFDGELAMLPEMTDNPQANRVAVGALIETT